MSFTIDCYRQGGGGCELVFKVNPNTNLHMSADERKKIEASADQAVQRINQIAASRLSRFKKGSSSFFSISQFSRSVTIRSNGGLGDDIQNQLSKVCVGKNIEFSIIEGAFSRI